ncbi:hypothetical protein SAMN02745108_02532 [Fibrobacter intestinalis]|uniref:Uncharacterized protein n=1 Tax=Fibrobacter intestinalis TaxID=28122 RepID=A0A1T4R475_9BACT|nr:hypothetical protein BGW94_2360 [Fibrobacter sp. NR9]SKA10677.1 hypothetical protein SAMN02745108_02532 [Fibrobacter intestinalis]
MILKSEQIGMGTGVPSHRGVKSSFLLLREVKRRSNPCMRPDCFTTFAMTVNQTDAMTGKMTFAMNGGNEVSL